MYKIVLDNWYQERGGINQEIVLPEDFITIEDAIAHLYENKEKILDENPVEALAIKALNNDGTLLNFL